jgi:hypothetical protein
VKEKIMMEGIHTEKCTTMEKEKKCARSREWVAVERLVEWGERRNEKIVVQKA